MSLFPNVLLLDEATSALDPQTEACFLASIHELHDQYTIIIVTHGLAHLDYVDSFHRLENGNLNEISTGS